MTKLPLLAALFLALAVVAFADPINISSGELLNFSYVNVSNETMVQDFFCASAPVCSSLNLSLNLSSGQALTMVNGSVSVTAMCAPVPDSTTTCSVRRTMGLGEHYENTTGVCNIDFKCETQFSNQTVEHTLPVSLYTENGQVMFVFDGKTQPFSQNSSFRYDGEVSFTCPVEITAQTFSDDELLEMCRETNPFLLQNLDLALRRGYEDSDSLQACTDRENAWRGQCDTQLIALGDTITACQIQVNGTNNALNHCLEEKQEGETRSTAYVIFAVLAGLWAMGATVLSGVFVYKHWRATRKTGGEE